MNKQILFAFAAFCIPVFASVILNWEAVEPYMNGNPNTAQGKLLYFASSG